MADRRVGTALRVRYRLTPWWVKVIVVFVLSRVVTTAILLDFAARQAQNPWTAAQPDYFQFAKIWDGHWYYIIAVSGYPADLPITEDGHVGESAWAFMPAFPALVRLFMLATGLDFQYVAPVVATLFALGAALMFYRVIAKVQPGSVALFSVVLLCVAPLSPILQVSYAESMQLFLLALALYLLMQRSYWMLLPVVAVMSLTRPSGLAFALRAPHAPDLPLGHPGTGPVPVRENAWPSWSSDCGAALCGVGWLLIAWAVTGSMTAYLDTELAWRRPYIGDKHLVPFAPWFEGAGFWQQLPAPFPAAFVILVAGDPRLRRFCCSRRGCAGSARTSGSGWRATRSTCSRCSSRSRARSGCSCRSSLRWAPSRRCDCRRFGPSSWSPASCCSGGGCPSVGGSTAPIGLHRKTDGCGDVA